MCGLGLDLRFGLAISDLVLGLKIVLSTVLDFLCDKNLAFYICRNFYRGLNNKEPFSFIKDCS